MTSLSFGLGRWFGLEGGPLPRAARQLRILALLGVGIGGCAPRPYDPGTLETPPAPAPVAEEPAADDPPPEGRAAAPSASTCEGSEFDADDPPRACVAKRRTLADPPHGALEMTVSPSPAIVKSGASATFVLTMKNATGAPLPLELTFGCNAFLAEAANDSATTFEVECGGLCGQGQPLRVTLAPQGVVHKRVRLDANMRRIDGKDCVERQLGPLPPGRYTMTIDLPWTDPSPIPGNPQARKSRVVEVPLEVTK